QNRFRTALTMIIEVKVPSPGESITEVQLASWLVKNGDFVEKDAEIAEIDSDKATLTINAAEPGIISLKVQQGDTIKVGALIATIDIRNAETQMRITPLARKIMEDNKLSDEEVIQQFGSKRVSKADIQSIVANVSNATRPKEPTASATASALQQPSSPVGPALQQRASPDTSVSHKPSSLTKPTMQQPSSLAEPTVQQPASHAATTISRTDNRTTERKKMSTLRLKLAHRLVSVKNETAMLTTFNEVNMSNIMALKEKYKEKFKEKYGVSLGFMSLFTKAVTIALHEFPQVNSIIDNDELIYHHYVDVGIAVSSPKGLVVPVVRNTELRSIANIEMTIKELTTKARNNMISLDEMTGGTFTISNGGVFGSLLSTPILNPPQSAILGMHNIVDRPIALNGQVVIAPMMYVALSYDHRVIDGRESVSFLVRVKELLENPEWMFYEGLDPIKGMLGL
ncbi:MAG: 2-oxoglutarate dehydrogenase complex dihydrolipoyllysine-residue succinyltransferase, partial [Lentimicrobiaceae bacterium]